MSDETVPPTPPSSTPPPPPPGGGAPPPPPGPSSPPPAAGGSSNDRQLMIVLAYLYPLVLIPYLTQKEDEEVQWHSRQGIVLSVAELAVHLAITVLVAVSGGLLGCVMWPIQLLLLLGGLVLRIMALTKGIKGERWPIPFVANYTSMVPR